MFKDSDTLSFREHRAAARTHDARVRWMKQDGAGQSGPPRLRYSSTSKYEVVDHGAADSVVPNLALMTVIKSFARRMCAAAVG